MVTRALALVFLASFGATTSFYLLLTVVPLYATSVGAGDIGAGLSTAALMFSTVAAELATPRLLARFGYRRVFAIGLVLLGAPAVALSVAPDVPTILAISAVRGLGFAVIVVAGSALVASLVARERRGEGLGLYGIVVGVPAVVALPLGVWLASNAGFPVVFVGGAASALTGLVAIPGLPGRPPRMAQHVGIVDGLRMPALVRPSLVFGASAMAAGVVVTFLPLAVTQASGTVATLGLLVQAATATVSRWWTGRYADRHGAAGLAVPALLAAAVGMLCLVLSDSPAAVLVGMLLFGTGFGISQNASLTLMFTRVSASGYGTVSALWNLAYDAGLGVGGGAFGVLAAQTGYRLAFALTAALMLVALIPAGRDAKMDT